MKNITSPEQHHRNSIHLKGYDYSQTGLYFITLCCNDRNCLNLKISETSIMILNPFGKIVDEEWKKTIEIRKNIALHEYAIMPNHFHAIIEILFPATENAFPHTKKESFRAEFKSPSQTIGAIIRGFKGASTKRIKEFYFSNKSTDELQFARNEKSYLKITEYIKNNAANWDNDRLY